MRLLLTKGLSAEENILAGPPKEEMGDRAKLSLQTLVQGFIFSLQVEGKVPSTVSYYQGNLRRFLWYACQHD